MLTITIKLPTLLLGRGGISNMLGLGSGLGPGFSITVRIRPENGNCRRPVDRQWVKVMVYA